LTDAFVPKFHPATGPIRPETTPLYTSSVYTFPSLDAVEAYYSGDAPDEYLYRRNGHPNERPVEHWLKTLEGTEDAVLSSSGMAAISQTCFALLQPGDHLLSTKYLYGGTYVFFEQILRPWGVEITYTDLNDADELVRCQQPNTTMLYAESIANPLLEVADLQGIGRFAQGHGLRLVVDNTFATPLLLRPVEHGAALSIHSLTKYLNGHSDVIGGVVCGSREDVEKVRKLSVTFGGTMAPFDAWMTERGLQTLHLRFPAQCRNAEHVAHYLAEHPGVRRVYYPGLASHGTHDTASRILNGGYGAMISFELQEGRASANDFVQRLQNISFAPSLGGIRSTVSHPVLTSHRAMPEQERTHLGITDGLIRLSVGAEPVHTLVSDLEQALNPA